MSNPSKTETTEIRRKRLRFRAWHRGTREADLIIGTFADRHIEGFDEAQLERFEGLLEMSDPDLYDWMMGRVPVPPALDHDVMHLLKGFTVATKPD
ncbi:MAG TPA: succinate dehydrogenase assembly factor 2 [Azospirillaceae bacterium]|nr:succinate dehydrogenase assembly factor 2 [Azospirillaceae bacterium]